MIIIIYLCNCWQITAAVALANDRWRRSIDIQLLIHQRHNRVSLEYFIQYMHCVMKRGGVDIQDDVEGLYIANAVSQLKNDKRGL